MVLLDDLLCRSSEDEINFNLASDCDVAQKGLAVSLVGNDWTLGVSVPEKDSNKSSSRLGLNQSERMDSVSLLSSETIIKLSRSFVWGLSPHRPGSFSETKSTLPLS